MEAEQGRAPEVGNLPDEGYIAMNYVPFQKTTSPRYTKEEALKNGTLYPGLNLPYRHFIPSKEVADSKQGQLMSIDFAINELGLYLDTHPKDEEALKLHNALVKMSKEATAAFEKEYGPVTQSTIMEGRFSWIDSPWPWEK